jgi:hypothetical protein
MVNEREMYEALKAWDSYTSANYPDNMKLKRIAWDLTSKAIKMYEEETGIRECVMEPVPPFGDIFEMKEMQECIINGSIIDDDGNGYYCQKCPDKMGYQYNCTVIDCSDIVEGKVDPKWTHVIWMSK